MSPRMTACAPSHRTNTMAPNTRRIASTVSSERARMRCSAVLKARSTELPKRCASTCSCVNACTVGIAFNTSPAIAEASATRSCESRDSLRTRRAKKMIGSTTSASITMMIADSLALVTNSITNPPANSRVLRNAIDTLVPTSVWISVVSVVRRDSTSPVCVVSKNCGLCVTTCA